MTIFLQLLPLMNKDRISEITNNHILYINLHLCNIDQHKPKNYMNGSVQSSTFIRKIPSTKINSKF